MNLNNPPRPSVAHHLALLFVGFLAFATTPCAKAARWYHVEVIVFKQSTADISGGEDWSVPDRTPNFATAIDIAEVLDGDGSVVPLSANAYYLAGVYDRLRASSKYEPVIHKAWAQPGYSANNVRSVYVSDGSNVNRDVSDSLNLDPDVQSIEGAVGLQGGRLLHVNVNLVFRDVEVTTTISEFRRIKLKQLHYFDHPLFGALIRVIPYKTAP